MSKTLDVLAQAVEQPKQVITPLTTSDKWKAITAVEKELNKQFDVDTSLIRLGSKVGLKIPSISTGLATLDNLVIGTGGIPRTRIIEIFGAESSGKTTLVLHIIGQEQKNGGICAFIDAEHALDPSWAARLGVDVDNLLVAQPDSGEQALTTVEALVDSRAVSLIVVDSAAALVPQAELDGEMGDSFMGLQARLIAQAMRKLRGKCSTNGIPVIFTNQIREKIGVIYGSNEVTPGGRSLKFYSSVRLDVRRRKAIDSGGILLGHQLEIKAQKNKVGTPFKSTIVDLIYESGFDIMADLVEYAIKLGVVEKKGAWLKFDEQNFHKDDLVTDKNLINKIKKELDKIENVKNEL